MVGIVGWDDQDANIAKLVHTWLSNESNGNWIMVIDNADILDVFTSTPSNSVAKSTSMNITAAAPQLQDYIPSSRNGRILITSRDKDVAFHLTCSWPHILEVEPMSEAEATTLLASKLVVTSPPDHLIELVEALGHMPLAISQAAAYISQRTPRETIKTYLERLKKGDEEADKLLGTDVREAGRDRQRTNSIMSTWHITFQYVRKHKPSAARLLSLMCLFDRQRIPEALLEEEYTEDVVLSQPLKNVTWWKRRKNRLRGSRKQHTEKPKMNCNFDDDWLTLMNFSLIKTREGGRSFTMHRLVQFTTKKWLKMQGELDYWTKRYVVMLKYWLSPNPKLAIGKEFRMIYGMVFSHAQAALDYRPKDDKELLIWVELMYCAGHWADHAGNWTAEEMMSRGALEAIEGLRGADDEFSLKVAYQLGYAQHVLRKYEESEAIFRRVLEGRCKILEPDHVNIISSLASIGLVLAKQGKLQEAYEMYVRKLDAQERRFGLADSDIHDSTRELAFEFFTYGGYKQAAALQRRLLDRTKNALGIEDETGVFHLTMMLHMQGEYEEAEAICRQVIETRTEKFGGDSLNVAETRIKLGDALASQKRYPEAEEQYRQALQKYEIETGEGNYNTWACMQQLAEVLAKLGKYEEAERFSYRLIEGRERLEGKDHCDTFVAIHTLATVLNEQERYEEALILYKKAYEGTKKKVGENHDDTKEFLEDYCRVQGILDSQKLDVVVIESEQLHDSDNCSAKSILEETNELVLDCAHV
jgi:tetratricopeptide (TPR) repeat protein